MKGEVVYLYAFDVANEIATEGLREVLSARSFRLTLRVDHTYPRDVPLFQALTVEPARTARLGGADVRLVIRIFEVGVVSVSMRVPCEVESLAGLSPFHRPTLDDGLSLDQLARQLCDEVCASIRDSLVMSSLPSEPEAYTVFCLTDLNGVKDVEQWFGERRREVAGLLAETPADDLSTAQVEESLRIQRSFTRHDLDVIDWDASLVVDLDGYVDDVLYVLELANLQLEEFRVMDRRLDRHLERAYRDLESYKFAWWRTPSAMLDWLRRFRVDVAKLADEVSHITKFFGDWHLARVYLGARERFHLGEWQQSVEHRLSQLDGVYSYIQSDVYERRMLWLEIAVVICFIVDLLGLFVWKR